MSIRPQSRSGGEGEQERIPVSLRTRMHDGGRLPSPDRARRGTLRWARWLHVYSSMIALLIVLFFGATGITLNHPAWTFGDKVDVTNVTGNLPIATTRSDRSVDFLAISEFVRDQYGVKGKVASFDVTNGQGSIAYKGAGYSAELFFSVDSGSYQLRVEQQGWVAVLNDLHKGRDTGTAWRWVIDISAAFLVLIACTGLAMQLVLRRRRRLAFAFAAVGALVVLLAGWVTLA